jgi:hypothetical protein
MRRAARGVGEVREEIGPQIRGGARQESGLGGSGSGEEPAFKFAVVDFSGAEARDFQKAAKRRGVSVQIFGLTEGEADSLTKANKTALVKIVTRIREMQNALELAQADSE